MAENLSLQEQLDAANTSIATLQETNGKLEAALKEAQEKATADGATIDALKQENEGYKLVNESLQKEVEAATVAPTELAKPVNDWQTKTFEFEGETFGFAFYEMSKSGQQITVEVVLADEALQAWLVQNNSTMLVRK